MAKIIEKIDKDKAVKKIERLKNIKQESKNRIAEFESMEHLNEGDLSILNEEKIRLDILNEVDAE